MGYFRGAVHILRAELATQLDRIPRDKKIVITDVGGYEPAMAAVLLSKLGYTDVSVLLEGIDRFLLVNEKDLPCKNDIYVTNTPYRVINVFAFPEYLDKNKGALILDTRSKEEFTNTHKDDFRNIGRLKDAVNIPVNELKDRLTDIPGDKNKPIIVYAFSGGPESYQAAKILREAGYSDVTVLMGGIFSMRWTAANDKSQAGLGKWVDRESKMH
jgi:rhodanese-related sulfurtransferase